MKTIENLRQLRDQARDLDYFDMEGLDAIKRRGEMLLTGLFGEDSSQVADLRSIWLVARAPRTHDVEREDWRRGRSNLVNLFTTAEEQLDLFGHPALSTGTAFVDPQRIAQLRQLNTSSFDLSRLVALCEELNRCASQSCFLATAALTRALLDHVPPIFSCSSFAEVANNYKGSQSFKKSMQNLESSARPIADAHLHTQIRKQESLPSETQVDFRNDIDVLLAEIIRALG